MNIGIDIRSLQEKQKSGVGEFTYRLLAALFKIDRENNYYLFSNAGRGNKPELPAVGNAKVSAQHFNYPNKLLNFGFRFFKTPKIDKLINDKIDVFIFPNINFYALSPNIKKILIVHDLSFKIFPEFFSTKGRLWHSLLNARRFCQSADKIVCVSQNTKNDLSDYFKLPGEKINAIYPGISEKFRPVTEFARLEKIKNKYSLPNNFILYLGTVELRKNIFSLIQAFGMLKNKFSLPHSLILAGARGYESEKILKYALQSKSADHIKYIGYVPEDEKPALYSLAKIFVYPSYYEGFGFPPLEAMCCGTPTVASHAGSLSEVLSEFHPIFINPYNVSELAHAMAAALKNPILCERDKILRKYPWQKTAGQVLEIIKTPGRG